MKPLKTGLISAGGISRFFLARIPSLLRGVGPVKATSFRVARRIVNSFRAGRPVESYAELNACSLIWIALPEAAVERALRELFFEIESAQKMIVICGDPRESTAFGRFAPDAQIATLDAVAGDERNLVMEGDSRVLREIRRIVAPDQRRTIEIPPGAKPLYLAGVHLASNLLLPCFSAAVELLRDAGFSRSQATQIAERLSGRALRSYGKAGYKAWSPATILDLRLSRERDLASVRAANPHRARVYERSIEQALEYFRD